MGSQREAPRRAGPFLLAAGFSAVVGWIAVLRQQPPTPRPADAPASQFSAIRARETLRRLVGDGVPHPVGSEGNARVRQRVIAELARLGYEPSVQQAFVCGRSGVCATVHNVLARRRGTLAGKAVMLSAHYDSVGSGPGASDDGVGVAALLEIARIVQSEKPRRNPVVLLIDDGEEAGMLGARAFAAEHPWAREVGAVVNVEARGTSGASLLFETSDENRWLARLAASALPRPSTSSVFYTIYKRLPNDTDLTVFREFGMAGVNFANIGDVARYHTPLDNFDNASPATLQHHGEHALAMARALADADLSAPHRGNAVFFDLLGAAIFWWPEEATLPAAIAALLLTGSALLLGVRRGALAADALAWGFAGTLLMLMLPVSACLAVLGLGRAAGVFSTQWVAHPMPLVVSLWALSLAAAWLPAALLDRRAGFSGLWAGGWTFWAIAALVVAVAAPGLSFLFLVPALAAGLSGVLAFGSSVPRRETLVAAVPAWIASLFWLPMAWLLYDALGLRGGIVIAAAVALPAIAVAPTLALLPRRTSKALLAILLGLSAAGLCGAALVPPFSRDSPQRMTIVWREDADANTARWLVYPESGVLPSPLKEKLGFGEKPVSVSPWSGRSKAFAAPAATAIAPGPEVTILEDRPERKGRRVRARAQSARGASSLFFAFAPTAPIESFSMGGTLLDKPAARELALRDGWRVYVCVTAPADGIDLEIVTHEAGPIELFFGDQSRGLPPGGEDLERLRPATAVPSDWGDLSVVARRIRF